MENCSCIAKRFHLSRGRKVTSGCSRFKSLSADRPDIWTRRTTLPIETSFAFPRYCRDGSELSRGEDAPWVPLSLPAQAPALVLQPRSPWLEPDMLYLQECVTWSAAKSCATSCRRSDYL